MKPAYPGTQEKKTNGYAVDVINNEGIAYAVQSYTSGHVFKDPITKELWNEAEAALNRLIKYLSDDTGRQVN